MWNKEECEVAKSYYTKVSALRADVHKMDWADDKRLSLGYSGGYGYLSMDKIVKQIAPLFNKHGLEIELNFYNLVQREHPKETNQYHWTVSLDVTLVDIDTGYKGAPHTVVGEAADVGDKGVTKAETSAYKNWHIKFFDLADGIDPDSDAGDMSARKFSRNDADKEEVTSKVLETAKKSTEAPASGPTPKLSSKLQEALQSREKAEQKEATAKEPKADPAVAEITPVEPTPAAPVSKFEPKLPQKRAIDGLLTTWEVLAKNGKVSVEEYNGMTSAYLDIDSDAKAVAFIRKYRRTV